MLPPDHPQRRVLADEVHARPPEEIHTPTRATYLALLVEPEDRAREQAQLAALCALHGVAPPAAGVNHFSAVLGSSLHLRWERHGEFSGITLLAPGQSPQPFSEPAAARLPPGWLAGLPGTTIVAAHAKLVDADRLLRDGEAAPAAAVLAAHFGSGTVVVGSEIGDRAGLAFTDFRIHADGFARFLICNRSFTPRQAGRMLQRLLDIETYRMMALLAMPVARRQAPQTVAIERALAALTHRIAVADRSAGGAADSRGSTDADEALLNGLTQVAAEVESALAGSQFRFGACRAYHELVTTRIGELREQRLPGFQTIDEFMTRRLTPAVATCATVSQRLHDLSERVSQASALLSTRVDIARERQNQALLASMDRRARLQLRLQQTVEGLSVAAIVYYVAGLVGYLAKAAKAGGLPVQPDVLVGLAVPVLVLAVMWTLRRARRALHGGDAAGAAGAATRSLSNAEAVHPGMTVGARDPH